MENGDHLLNSHGECLWCGGPLKFLEELEDRNLRCFPKPVPYGKCEYCDSVCQLSPLEPQQLGQAYSNMYWVEEKNESFLGQIALWYQQRILSWDQGLFLRRVAHNLRGKKILEIGPGRGDFLVWARAQGGIVSGWERSPRAVSYLKAKGLKAESVVLEDLSLWPEPEESWDLIAGFHVLEHLVEPRRVVDSLLTRLALQGTLVFQVPRIDSWQARVLGHHWIGLDAPRHVSIPSLKGLRKFAANWELQELACKHFSLRDNSFHILTSLFPWMDPHRHGFRGFKMVQLLVGTWCLQPMAFLEALSGKGGTVMIAFQRKSAS